MKANWVAFAAVAAFACAPALAQDTDATVTAPATGTTTQMNYTNVDLSRVRSQMNQLRDYLGRIETNNRLGNATVDVVQQDAYRRMNVILGDDAYALGLNLLDALGPATRIPPGLGATRDYIQMTVDHLRHARLVGTFSEPIEEASESLTHAFDALNTANVAMVGVTVTPGMQPGMMQPGMMQPGMTQPGTTESGTMQPGTTPSTENQANPGASEGNTGSGTTDETTPPQ